MLAGETASQELRYDVGRIQMESMQRERMGDQRRRDEL